MPHGGGLVIRTRREAADAGVGTGHGPAAPGDRVRLDVIDRGVGMPPQARTRACEPFYTTRPESNAGLGLAAVQDVALRAGGDVVIRSEWGAGTTVEVRCPRAGPMGSASVS